jgi:hypothetical protein
MEHALNDKATIAALRFATKLVHASSLEPDMAASVFMKRRRHFYRLLWLLCTLDPTATWEGVHITPNMFRSPGKGE